MGIKKVKDNILYSNNIKNNYILNRSAVANLVIDKKKIWKWRNNK